MRYECICGGLIAIGCDYCDSIRGIGPKKALAAIREHKSIEKYLQHIKEAQPKGVVVPQDWLTEKDPMYQQARGLFTHADVLDCSKVQMNWSAPQEEELKKFLVDEKGFSAERVASAIEKLKKAKSSHSQQRLDSFFKVTTVSKKRPADDKKNKATKKGRGKAK